MEGKRSAADINKALENLKRNNNVIDNTKYMKAVNGPPSRVVFSVPQPPTPPGWNQAPSTVGSKREGGMAFLGLKVQSSDGRLSKISGWFVRPSRNMA